MAAACRSRRCPCELGADVESAIPAYANLPNGGLVVIPSPATLVYRDRIIALAAQHRLPAVYPYRFYVAEGGLASYGEDLADQYRQAAGYVARILGGTKPAELPVQQATRYALAINRKTAQELGLAVPLALLVRADEVIE